MSRRKAKSLCPRPCAKPREAARIRPGDRVTVRVRPEGGVIIEAEAAVKSAEAYMEGLKDMSRRRPFRGFSTEEIMRMTRGED
jgi:antitoxin PrlF